MEGNEPDTGYESNIPKFQIKTKTKHRDRNIGYRHKFYIHGDGTNKHITGKSKRSPWMHKLSPNVPKRTIQGFPKFTPFL